MIRTTIRSVHGGCLLIAILSASARGHAVEPPPACSRPLFDNPEYQVGSRPTSVATADLDGDGDLDVVTANFHEGTISVLLNNGDGTFADDVKYEAGFEPASIAIGDLDDDGDLDLVVSSGGGANFDGNLPGTVSVLLNPGDGTFANQTIHDLGILPFSVALGDLDGDDDLDMAIAVRQDDEATPNGVQIMFNSGNGTFVFGANIFAGDYPAFVVIGDLDDDEDLDLAVTSWTEEIVSVFLNNGGGRFANGVTYPAGIGPVGLAVGDLDDDGDLDLAAANLGPVFNPGTTVSILLNSGNATFAMPVPYGVGQAPSSVIITDLDADGDADLALTNLHDDTASVLLNNGDATFADDVTYGVGDGPSFVAAGDFDGDVDRDLAVVNSFRNTLSILHAHSDGSFQDVVNLDVGEGPSAVAIDDLDGDGDLDLAVAIRGGIPFVPGKVSILLNQGDGAFAEQVAFGTGTYPEFVAIGDLDGDGDGDIAVTDTVDHTVSILLNGGAGRFADAVAYNTGPSPLYLAIGDLDDDGDLDLAVANGDGENVSILLNHGDGTFADHVTYQVGGGDFSIPTSIALGDVDGDGDLDFAVGLLEPLSVSVQLNNGMGAFGNEVLYSSTMCESVAFADLDGDRDLDLLSACGSIGVRLNDGKGIFAEPVYYESISSSAYALDTGDMDGDGDLDIVAGALTNTIVVLLNNGNGAFANFEAFRTGNQPRKLAIGDLNGDGALDVATPNVGGDNVSVLFNRCADIPADLDGDGVVGAGDLIILLGSWGLCADCGDCPADLDGDCTVGSTDLIMLLGSWG